MYFFNCFKKKLIFFIHYIYFKNLRYVYQYIKKNLYKDNSICSFFFPLKGSI